MTYPIVHCAYTGEPTEAMDLAVQKVADQYDGALGDSGWGCGEREIEIEFDAKVDGVVEALLAAGCTRAEWNDDQ